MLLHSVTVRLSCVRVASGNTPITHHTSFSQGSWHVFKLQYEPFLRNGGQTQLKCVEQEVNLWNAPQLIKHGILYEEDCSLEN